ncbi:MAG: hypothetical protein U0I22_05085 [Treponema sp.]|nr:hypothetical protein [Treponema sp.]
MKKLFVLLGVFCALCFVACSNFQLAGGDMGVVSLSIGDNLAREIRSAASLRSATGGSYTLTASIRGEYSDSQTVAVANGNYSGVTFTFEGVPVGKKIILDLTAKAGSNYIWYGNSGNHTVEQGENLLTIALGRVSGVLMWNSSSVKIAPYGNLEEILTVTGEIVPPVYCYDNSGNLYRAGSNGVSRFDLQSDGTYPSSATDSGYSGGANFIAYDNASNILYGMDPGIFEFKKNAGSNPVIEPDALQTEVTTPIAFAVHNNIAYVADQSEGDDDPTPIIKVVGFNLQDKSKQGEGAPFKLPAIFGNQPTYQMIYHEGALYLLLRNVEINDASDASVDLPAEHFSIGALVKINPTTLSLDTSFGNGGYLGLSSMKKKFSGLSASDGTSVDAVNFYGSGNDASTFYGPVGFVAIMPKKLVIADAGFSMEQEGTKVNLTKKTRVITVDLETLAFETERVEDSYYQSEYPSSSTIGYSYIVITN